MPEFVNPAPDQNKIIDIPLQEQIKKPALSGTSFLSEY
jgi:hypothetical protein